MRMLGDGAMGSKARYLALEAARTQELFAKADGFTTPITPTTPSFKAPSAGGGAKPKVAALKPTGNTLPSPSNRLAALRENLQAKIGQSSPAATPPTPAGAVGKALNPAQLRRLEDVKMWRELRLDGDLADVRRWEGQDAFADRSHRKSVNFVERFKWDEKDGARRLANPKYKTSPPRGRSLTADDKTYLGLPGGSGRGTRQGLGAYRGGEPVKYEFTGNKRVRKAERLRRKGKFQRMAPSRVAKSLVELPWTGPTHAMHAAHGRVRILAYHGENRFTVLDRTDTRRLAHRDDLTFVKDPKISKALNKAQQMRLLEVLARKEDGPAATRAAAAQRGRSALYAATGRRLDRGASNPLPRAARRRGFTDEDLNRELGRRGDAWRASLGVKKRNPLPPEHFGLKRLKPKKPQGVAPHFRGMHDSELTPEQVQVRRALMAEAQRKASEAAKPGLLAAKETQRAQRYGQHRSQQKIQQFMNRERNLEKREPLKTSISEDDARKLVERHGLKGPLPAHLDREQKMAAYEARYVSAGGKKAEKWDHRARMGDKAKNVGLGIATVGGAGWLATRGKFKGKAISPRLKHHIETVAGAGATAGGAGELYAAHARRKRSSYASAPAGVAASALRRMRDYTP